MPSSLLCEFLCWCQICFFLPLFEHPLEGEVCKLWSSERRKIWSRKFKSFWRLLPSIGAEFSTFSSRLTSLHHPPAIRPSFHVPVYSHTHAHLLSCLGNMEWRWDFYVCLFLDFMDRVFITGTEEHKNTELEPFFSSPPLARKQNRKFPHTKRCHKVSWFFLFTNARLQFAAFDSLFIFHFPHCRPGGPSERRQIEWQPWRTKVDVLCPMSKAMKGRERDWMESKALLSVRKSGRGESV